MKKIIITLALSALSALAIVSPAHAASHSEAATRKASGIPASIVYLKGTAVWVSSDTRCFQAQATKRTHVQGQPIHLGRIVGYCTDGYVDRTKGSNMSQYHIINPGR